MMVVQTDQQQQISAHDCGRPCARIMIAEAVALRRQEAKLECMAASNF